MSFKRDSLSVLLDRTYSSYTSLFKPLEKTPRQSLLKVFASVDAGIYHQLLGDLDFLSEQIFPDTARGEYLRSHWSSRVPPLYAVAALGEVTITGFPNRSIPASVVFQAASGERYYLLQSYKLSATGEALVTVKAQNPGAEGNLAAAEKLSIVSAIPAGIDSEAVVSGTGISGGIDAESDEEYLVRVLASLRNSARYGKPLDYAAWALDATPEVSRAWEFKNFGVFGALLIEVISGNQTSGVEAVQNLAAIRDHISSVSPPILFDVRTPLLVSLNPAITLLPQENTLENRSSAEEKLKSYLDYKAAPGVTITAGELREAVIDGLAITDAEVRISGSTVGYVKTTILEYPVLGAITWE